MAPVGSRESLAAAINAGAQSVYFGIGQLNMRAHSASAFTINDLREIAATCHEHGIKSYLTVNTVIYGEDIDTMHQIVDAAKAADISAIIASDVAVMTYARSINQEVHLSTQLNISNIEALKFYAQFADVVVLARELNMDQVADIYRQVIEQNVCGPSGNLIRIEMFCHGALCMAISGKCYLSLQNANRSANRGECVQICRRGYRVTDIESGTELEIDNKYIMSPKDLKTIRFIDRMMRSGVRVFKIEGRARGPEYVDTVVRCYDEAINAVLHDWALSAAPASVKTAPALCTVSSGASAALPATTVPVASPEDATVPEASASVAAAPLFTEAAKDAWDERLSRVFNRGFWDGYYQGQTLGEWNDSYGSKATEKKIYCAKVMKYFSKIGVAEFQVEAHEIEVGDKLLITGPTTGALYLDCNEIRYDLRPVSRAEKGWRISIPVPDKVRPSDKLFVLKQCNV